MTNEEKRRITELQVAGCGYKKISQLTGLPLNTVKSYLRRNLGSREEACCRQCGKAIQQLPRTREKHFCSDKCRLTWWNAHPGEVSRSTTSHTCKYCRESFESHIAKQQFCSRACYANARRKVGTANG